MTEKLVVAQKPNIAMILIKGHEYAARLAEGAMTYLQEQPGPHVFELPYEEGQDLPELSRLNLDGAMLWVDRSAQWVEDLRRRDVKLVSCNGEWYAENIPSVGFSLNSLTEAVIGHLIGLGPRQLAFVTQKLKPSVMRRMFRDSFVHCARQEGLAVDVVELPGVPSEERHRLMEPENEKKLKFFLSRSRKPVSVFCDDDYLGVLVCQVALHLGLKVPQDVAVLGMLDMLVGKLADPTLSSVPQPGQLVGYEAMKLLVDMLDGRPAPSSLVPIKCPPIIIRESTGGRPEHFDDIERARQLIQEHACEGITVNEILESVTVSQKTLNKRFMEATGRTPAQEIRYIRVENAKRWLATTDLSITRIAGICGFSESSKFNTFFKREAGCTPTQYRAGVRQK